MKVDVLKTYYPGFVSAAIVGLAATFLARNYNAPVMLFALLIGMAFMVTATLVNNMFQGKKIALSIIDGAHWVGVAIIEGIVIALLA